MEKYPGRIKRNKSGWWLLFLLLWSIGPLLADQKFPCQWITLREGLTDDTIRSLLQDHHGFIWIGTPNGLNRYDGYHFKCYWAGPDNPGSLPSPGIRTLYEDALGTLWIGTLGGLCRYNEDLDNFTVYRHSSKDSRSISSNNILAIFEDTSGNLWIGTKNGGLNKFDRTTGRFKAFKKDQANSASLSNNTVTCVLEGKKGHLWVGTEEGLNRFNLATGTFSCYTVQKDNIHSISDNNILCLFKDSGGDLWIGTLGGGLNRYEEKFDHFVRYKYHPSSSNCLSNNDVRAIEEDAQGNLLIGTLGGGLNEFNRQTRTFIQHQNNPHISSSISSNSIYSICLDRSGIIWVGTWGGGLNKLDKTRKKFFHLRQDPDNNRGLNNNEIRAIHEDSKGMLWIGTWGGGLNRYDPQTGECDYFLPSSPQQGKWTRNVVMSLQEDLGGILWVGTLGEGLLQFDRESKKFSRYTFRLPGQNNPPATAVLTMYQDRETNLWCGTLNLGLIKLGPDRKEYRIFSHERGNPESISSNQVYGIAEGKNGVIWLGTGKGLNKLDTRSFRFRRFLPRANEPDNPVNEIVSLRAGKTGKIWLGTNGGGLLEFDIDTEVFTSFKTIQLYQKTGIWSIEQDQSGNLWYTSDQGLFRLNLQTKKVRRFKVSDGLQSSKFNQGASFRNRKGELFFGGINGLNRFHPRDIQDNQHVPKVVITGFEIFNKPIHVSPENKSILRKSILVAEKVTLSHHQNSFSFTFSALDQTAPRKNQYRYKLEGFNSDWIKTSGQQNRATFTNIDPGNYIFWVKGSNNDGVWNDTPAKLKINIIPPFWQTWWFRIIMAIAIINLIILLHKRRTSHIRTNLERKRLEKEIKIKADYSAMIAHDLRSPLTAILGYADLLAEEGDKLDTRKTGKIIHRSSERMLRLINDMLDISKFEAGKMKLRKKKLSLVKTIKDIQAIMEPLFLKKEVTLTLNQICPAADTILNFDGEKIGQVINNLLGNAIKFVPPKGIITIDIIKKSGEYLEVTIFNNGPSIPREKQKFLFGMYNQLDSPQDEKGTGLGLVIAKMIIESHNGYIGYRDPDNQQGCIFYFGLPLNGLETAGGKIT